MLVRQRAGEICTTTSYCAIIRSISNFWGERLYNMLVYSVTGKIICDVSVKHNSFIKNPENGADFTFFVSKNCLKFCTNHAEK